MTFRDLRSSGLDGAGGTAFAGRGQARLIVDFVRRAGGGGRRQNGEEGGGDQGQDGEEFHFRVLYGRHRSNGDSAVSECLTRPFGCMAGFLNLGDPLFM